jgi:hypothetical protein
VSTAWQRALVTGAAALCLAGCSGESSDPTAVPSATVEPPAPSATPGPSETPISAMARDDPRRLISEEDPGPELAHALTSGIQHVQDLTAEIHGVDAVGPFTTKVAIDYGGDCSFKVEAERMSYEAVIRDGVAVETVVEGPGAAELDGRWVRVPDDNAIAHRCDDGFRTLIDGSPYATGATWLLMSGRRIGMEKVRGLPALHVRQDQPDGRPVDVWVAVVDDHLLPVKIAWGVDGGATAYYSRFNESTIRDMPSDDQILDQQTAPG